MKRRLVLFAAVLLAASPALAAPIKTTTCETKKNETITKGGKTYSGCTCNVCKTTTCQTGGAASCTIETTRSCDCPDNAAAKGRKGVGTLAPKAGSGAVLSD